MERPRRAPHPFVYSLLIMPFGAVGGFVTVALAFLATRSGLTVQDGATLIAVNILPHTWKFFWAPVADTTLSRKRWYVLSCSLCAVGIVAMSAVPLGSSTLRLLEVLTFVTNVATTFLAMSVESMMAHVTPPGEQGRVGGWFQAGNLGGGGLGGGAGLWMVMHLPAPWMAGVVLGLSFLGCCLVLRFLPEIPAESRDVPLARAIRNVGVDLWVVVKSRTGLLCAILCFLPIGTGAATGVLAQAEVAAHWHAGENEVELVNGLLSGLIAAIGCLAGGWFCTRYSPRRVYAAVGACMAAVSLSMAAAPDTPATFVVFGLSYSFVTGMAYAAFSGFVLEVIGAGAAATKYNVFAALSNMPIMYMGLILAWSVSRVGTHGMLVSEAAFGVGGIAVLALAATALRAGPGGTPVPVPAIEAVVEPAQD